MAVTKERISDAQTRMEKARSSHESAWAEIASLVWPEMEGFHGKTQAHWRTLGHVPESHMHEPYAAIALDDGVSVFEGFIMPRGKRWQRLALPDELMMSVANQQWLERVETRLFDLRHDPESGFVGATSASAKSLMSFGMQSMWIDLRYDGYGVPVGLRYQSEFVGEIFRELDADSGTMRTHRKFGMTAEQAMLAFGKDAPKAVRDAMDADKPVPDRPFEIVHFIEYNPERLEGRMDAAGMPWRSGYYLCGHDDDEIFKPGGYRSLPRVTSVMNRAIRSDYGFSNTMRVLPEIRLLQEIQRDRVFGAELRLMPPLLLPDDGLDGAIVEYQPGGATMGGLDERGNARVKEWNLQTDSSDAQQLATEARAAIDKAYGRDLLQLNREYKTHITATRTAEEMAEKGIMLAPLARQEDEWLSPMTQRELALLGELGGLDDMPDEVAEYVAAEGGFGFKYDNQLGRMLQASDTAAFLSLGEQVAALSQLDPKGEGKLLQEFLRTYPMEKVLPWLGDNAGVPASIRATDEELAAHDRAKAQEQAGQELLQAIPVIAQAAQNTANLTGGTRG